MESSPIIESGSWRCAGCGHGKEIYACAEAIVSGQLEGAELVTEDSVEQVGLCGGSEECRVHQSTEPLERWNGEEWVQWVTCDACEGRGQVKARWDVRIDTGCSRCAGAGGHWPGLSRLNPFGAH